MDFSKSHPFSACRDRGYSKPGKKRKSEAPADEVDTEILRQLKQGQELDEEDHYRQSVAGTLRKMSPEQRALAKIRIQQILYEIQYSVPQAPHPGSYHQGSHY